MLTNLRSPEAIEMEIQGLGHLCEDPNVEDQEACLAGIATWWPMLAEIIYADPIVPYICNGINNECELFR